MDGFTPAPTSDILTRLLLGASGGALGGAGAGAAVGALRSPDDRRAGAVAGARSGALGGAALGATMGGGFPLLANILNSRRDLHLRQLVDPATPPEHVGTIARLIEAMGDLRDLSAAAAPSGPGALGRAAATSASGALGTAAAGHVAGRLRQKLFPKKTTDVAQDDSPAYGGDDAPEKSGAVAAVPPEDTPQDQRSRRIAELLKRAVPTSSAGGSASPTPPRGTP